VIVPAAVSVTAWLPLALLDATLESFPSSVRNCLEINGELRIVHKLFTVTISLVC
jgi:hypothetical protein